MSSKLFRHPYLFTTLLVLFMLTVGTGGYMVLEGWSFTDALFMTVITVTTIGYGETHPLSAGGRVFTIGLIMTGVVTASYAIGATVEMLTSTDFLERLQRRRKRQMLAKLEKHSIVCGYGRLGSSLARELQARGVGLVVIDMADEVMEQCAARGIPTVQGNASDENVLREARIEQASSLIAATPSDAENVFIVLTAKSIKPGLQVIARSNLESSIPKLEKAGANTVISPYAIVGRRIAHMLTRPNVTQFLDGVLEFGDQQLRLEEFIIGQHSALAGLSLREARLNVVVLATDYPGQPAFNHPNAETRLLPGMAIIVMGPDPELRKVEEMARG
jgi:voltage-gated potassium channel